MAQDIFVPVSSPDDALVGPLHTVTWVTGDRDGVANLLGKGYSQTSSGWQGPAPEDLVSLNSYLGFDDEHTWDVARFDKHGDGTNVGVRVIGIDQSTACVRPVYEGLYKGGATISCPMVDMRAHEAHMDEIGVESTIGVKEMEFQSPTGETYISAEIVYKAPDHVFAMGVTRPDIFVPVGPLDAAAGIGGVAYSARCITTADDTMEFFKQVLGWEIRRDVEFVVGERSAINMPEGTKERFIQGFAPGASSGYIVLMDHGDVTQYGETKEYGPPLRGIVMWTFPTRDLNAVYERAQAFGAEILHAPERRDSPTLGEVRTLMLRDPDGFPIEIFEQ